MKKIKVGKLKTALILAAISSFLLLLVIVALTIIKFKTNRVIVNEVKNDRGEKF